ncbi:Protein transport protein sec20 [Rhodosporidiobolus nylandii]
MSATSDVTEGLRRTLQLMQQEVDRSLVSNELLQSQTQTMQLTSDEYSTLSSLMSTSKSLITSLERADILDRLLLFGAFAFFAAVCAHIFKKRVLDKGVRVAGALGKIAARGGGALAGVAKHAGLGEHVEQAHEVGAGEVVRREVLEEVAHAAATATAVVGAIKAGVTSLAGGARRAHEQGEREKPPAAAPFEDVVPSREEARAAPVRPEFTDEAEEEEEAYEDAPEEPLFEEEEEEEMASEPAQQEQPSPLPVPVQPIDSIEDDATVSSSAAPLPSQSTDVDALVPPPTSAVTASPSPTPAAEASPSPAASPAAAPEPETAEPVSQLPPDEAPAAEEGHGLFERGDPDLHELPPLPSETAAPEAPALTPLARDTPAQPPAGEYTPSPREVVEDLEQEEEVEPATQENEHLAAPTPSIEHVPELAGETPVSEPLRKPDLEDAMAQEQAADAQASAALPSEMFEAGRRSEQAEAGQEGESVVADAAAPFASDDSAINALAQDEDLGAPAAASSSFAATDDVALPESTTMPSPPSEAAEDSLAADSEPVHIAVEDPAIPESSPAGIVRAAQEADLPREVAGPEGTTVPLPAGEAGVESVPPLDVNEEGYDPDAAEAEGARSVELPIDLEKEQTLWDGEHGGRTVQHGVPEPVVEESTGGPEEPLVDGDRVEQQEQESEEQLLDEMLEQQFGGVAGVVGGTAANAIAADSQKPEQLEAQQQQVEHEGETQPTDGNAPPAQTAYSHEDVGEAQEPAATSSHTSSSIPADTAEPTLSSFSLPVGDATPPIIHVETPLPYASANYPDFPLAEHAATASAIYSTQPSAPSPSSASALEPAPPAEAEPSTSLPPSSEPVATTTTSLAPPEPTPQPEAASPAEPSSTLSETSATSSTQSLEPSTPVATVEEDAPDAVAESTPLPSAASRGDFEGGSGALSTADLPQATPTASYTEAVSDNLAASAPTAETSETQPAATPSLPSEGATAPSVPYSTSSLTTEDFDVDLANSDVLYPDASIEESPSFVESTSAGEDDVDGSSSSVFEAAANEAVSSHVGEDEPALVDGHDRDERLHEAEDRLHELEEEGGAEEEFETGDEGARAKDEL